MRLLRKVAKIEKTAVAAAGRSRTAYALVWTRNNERVPADRVLSEEEHVAVNVHVLSRPVVDPETGVAPLPAEYSIRERVTATPGDQGCIYDASGLAIGRVHLAEGPFVDLEFFDQAVERRKLALGLAAED